MLVLGEKGGDLGKCRMFLFFLKKRIKKEGRKEEGKKQCYFVSSYSLELAQKCAIRGVVFFSWLRFALLQSHGINQKPRPNGQVYRECQCPPHFQGETYSRSSVHNASLVPGGYMASSLKGKEILFVQKSPSIT